MSVRKDLNCLLMGQEPTLGKSPEKSDTRQPQLHQKQIKLHNSFINRCYRVFSVSMITDFIDLMEDNIIE